MDPLIGREETLFAEALPLSASERATFLTRACGDDTGLKSRIEALLAAHARTTGAFDRPAAFPRDEAAEPPETHEQAGDRIDRYKLLERLGEGGWGVVWMAEQEEPVRRRVALKVIKPGMDTRAVIARFEAERQALAMMDHPNIARVFDAGATESGRPFFVMELVRGRRITDYCDENQLTTDERLRLFIEVSHAVQHAHQKGIIHRDLKPSNILVTQRDGRAAPKVIDFGIAKATQERLTDKTVFTAFAQFIGTPAYMSPEQAELSEGDVDTRSDIYSLGVLLYELLTGRTPFDSDELARAGLDAMRHTIREKEPVRPSMRLSTTDRGELDAIARRRGTEPPKLLHLVRGDLDWIVMRCLEKDRSRRYETVNGLAMDVRRFLADEPVVARPPGVAYRMGKLARRHRVAVFAGTTVLCALIAGLVIALVGLRRAVVAHHESQVALEEAEAVTAFLDNTLAAANPARFGHDVTVRAVLDAAVPAVHRQFADRPLLEARLQETIGRTYQSLAAEPEAAGLLREAVATRTRLLGPTHALTLRAKAHLANASETDAGLPMLEEVLACYGNGDGYPAEDVVYALRTSGDALDDYGRMDEALNREQRAVALARAKLPPESDEALWAEIGLAVIHWARGEFAAALDAHRRVLGVESLPQDHNARIYAIGGAAVMEEELGQFKNAETHAREALEFHQRLHGPDHPTTMLAQTFVGISLARQGKAEEGLQLLHDVFTRQQSAFGPDHYFTTFTHLWIASALAKLDRVEDAAAIGREIWTQHQPKATTGWAFLCDRAAELDALEVKLGHAEAAEKLARDVFGLLERMPLRPYTLSRNRIALAQALSAQGKFSDAERQLLENDQALATYPFDVREQRQLNTDALASLYAAWDKPDQAAAWQEKRQALRSPE